MPLEFSYSQFVVATAQSSTSIRLHHGTKMAENIVEMGVNPGHAESCGGDGCFWVTTDPEVASWYAATATGPSDSRAILGFDLPFLVLNNCVSHQPPIMVNEHGDGVYEFLPESFSLINTNMANITITLMP